MDLRKSVLAITAISIFCFYITSCSHPQTGNGFYKVKTEIDSSVIALDTFVWNHSYTYDGQGRLSQDRCAYYQYWPSGLGHAADTSISVRDYTYSGNTINVFLNNHPSEILNLNGQGLIASKVILSSTNSNDTDFLYSYQYNSNGYMISYDNGFSTIVTCDISNNNVANWFLSGNGAKQIFFYNSTLDMRDLGLHSMGKGA